MADDSYIKDPSARLDYTWDWGPWLADVSDTIASATVTVPDGLTAAAEAVVSETLVTQRVEGGDLDGAYTLACRITTVGGLIDKRSLDLTINNR
ncbi:phage fiber-tail adaptor protein [Streptomyces prunicolor]